VTNGDSWAKTEVVVFGGEKQGKGAKEELEKRSRNDEEKEEEVEGFAIGGVKLKVSDGYKYLGVKVKSDLKWNKMKEAMRRKARSRMGAMFGANWKLNDMDVDVKVKLWETMVRSGLEYGSEVYETGVWKEAEMLQMEMGRRILRCQRSTSNEAVMGELGWWRMKARREMGMLMFWGRLTKESEVRLAKKVYRWTRAMVENGEKGGSGLRGSRKCVKSWDWKSSGDRRRLDQWGNGRRW